MGPRIQTENKTKLKPFSLVFHFKINKQYNINSVNKQVGEPFTINLLNVLVITVTTKPRLCIRLYLNAILCLINNKLLLLNYYFCWRLHKHPYLWADTWASLTVCLNLKNSLAIVYHCSWKRIRSFLS